MTRNRNPTVLYPYCLDRDYPIPTIHRELSYRLSDSFDITAFREDKAADTQDIVRRSCHVGGKSRPAKAYLYWKEFFKQYDVVHTHSVGLQRYYPLNRVASARGATIVQTFHTPYRKERQKKAAKYADIITAVYPYVKEWVETNLDVDHVQLIHNGVDVDFFHPENQPTTEDYYIYVGRFVDHKHPEVFLNIAKNLPDATFEMAGTGPLKKEIREQAPDNLHIKPGWTSKAELRDMYSAATAIICPYENQAVGLVGLEALASDTPVIVLDKENTKHLIDDTNGIKCNSSDLPEWITAIRQLSTETYRSRESVLQYSWDNIAEEYATVYKSAI